MPGEEILAIGMVVTQLLQMAMQAAGLQQRMLEGKHYTPEELQQAFALRDAAIAAFDAAAADKPDGGQ
jgi:hypothetical protein